MPQTGNVVGFYASGGSLPSGQGQLATLSFDLGAERFMYKWCYHWW